MPGQRATGYLPGDPRYGLQGEALNVDEGRVGS